jgi:hypothetical protein
MVIFDLFVFFLALLAMLQSILGQPGIETILDIEAKDKRGGLYGNRYNTEILPRGT